ncbi:MAG: hypothetical protein ACREDT_06565 [Methylocella sp.]
MNCDPNTYPFLGYFCIERNVNISTVIAILLFILGYVLAKLIERNNSKKLRKKYLVALVQEIDTNVDVLKKTFDSMPPRSVIEDFIAKGLPEKLHNRPLLTTTYSTIVFSSSPDVLRDLDYLLIKTIIQFYGRLDTIKTDVGSIEYKAYETISPEGRIGLIEFIRKSIEFAMAEGKNASDGISMYLRLAL